MYVSSIILLPEKGNISVLQPRECVSMAWQWVHSRSWIQTQKPQDLPRTSRKSEVAKSWVLLGAVTSRMTGLSQKEVGPLMISILLVLPSFIWMLNLGPLWWGWVFSSGRKHLAGCRGKFCLWSTRYCWSLCRLGTRTRLLLAPQTWEETPKIDTALPAWQWLAQGWHKHCSKCASKQPYSSRLVY